MTNLDALRRTYVGLRTKQALSPYVKAPAVGLGSLGAGLGALYATAPMIGARFGRGAGQAAGQAAAGEIRPAVDEARQQFMGDFQQAKGEAQALRDDTLGQVDQRLGRAEQLPGRAVGQMAGQVKDFFGHPAAAIGLGLGAGALAGGLLGGHRQDVDAQGRPVRKRRLWPVLFGAGAGGLGAAGLIAARRAGVV